MSDDAGTSAHRIRVGLTGLAIAFLLVLLGSVISKSSEDEANATEPNEPLAELGVAPGGSDTDNASNQD